MCFDATKKKRAPHRVGSYGQAADCSLQLGALPAGGKPQSMGMLDAARLEPKGGAPSEAGPVLFKGALIQTML